MRPFGAGLRPSALFGPAPGGPSFAAHARPLCAGSVPPVLQAVALAYGPRRMAFGPRHASALGFLRGPGRHRPGRSGRRIRSGSASGRLRPSGRGPPRSGSGSCAAHSSPGRGLVAPPALPWAVPAPPGKGQGQGQGQNPKKNKNAKCWDFTSFSFPSLDIFNLAWYDNAKADIDTVRAVTFGDVCARAVLFFA